MLSLKKINKFSFSGKVIKGQGYGRKIGFPTANIDRREFLNLKKKPKLGVYSGYVFLKNKKYRAGIIIGPIDKKGFPKLEAHIISFKKNIYGKKITIKLNKFIRKYRKFKSEKELIIQIGKDLRKC